MHRFALIVSTLAPLLAAQGCGAPPLDPSDLIDPSSGASHLATGLPGSSDTALSQPPAPEKPGAGEKTDVNQNASMAPQIVLDARSLFFGQVCAEDSLVRLITITNQGTGPLRISGLSVTGAGYALLAAPPTPVIVAPGRSRQLSVRFSPAAIRLTPYLGTLRIDSDDPAEPVIKVPLSGLVLPPTLTLTPRTVAFGELDSGADRTRQLTLTNNGSCVAQVTDYSVSGLLSNSLSVGTLPDWPLQPGDSAQVEVDFTCDQEGDADIDLRFLDSTNRSVASAQLTATCLP